VSAHTLILHEPYLCGISHASEAYAALERLGDDELMDLVARVGIQRCTNVGRINELLEELAEAAAGIRHVQLVTRGDLGHSGANGHRCQAAPLLSRWREALEERFCATLGLTIDARVHKRRCVFQGPHSAIEVCIDWPRGSTSAPFARRDSGPGG
jgi:hypothetical protein